MLYDLNIVWTPQTAQTELERTLRFSKALGYDVVALNHILEAPISAQATNPIPQVGPVHPSFPPAKDNKSSTTTTTSSSSSPSSRRDLPIVLRRATILVSDPSTNHRLPHLAQSYSLLAARPTTDKAFAALTTGTSYPEIALISLDLSVSQPFRFRPKPCMAAVSRGVLFEVCYGQLTNNNNNNHGGSAMLASTDPQQRARANFIANMMELVRATKGRGIVISSECRLGTATSAAAAGWNLRAPADLVNLFACWGLGPERGLEALGANPRAVVVNEGLRRRSYRGVVDIVDAEGRIPCLTANKQTVTMTTETDSEISDKHGAKKKKNHNNNNKSQQQGQNNAAQQQGGGGANAKRKLDGQGTGGGGEQQDTKGQSLPVMSKRHTKKMKLAAER